MKDLSTGICNLCDETKQVLSIDINENLNISICQTCFNAISIKFKPYTHCFSADINHENCGSFCSVSNITTSILYDTEKYESKDFDKLIIPMLYKILDKLGQKFNKRISVLEFHDEKKEKGIDPLTVKKGK